MTIEDRFDVPLIAGLALREKQIQQNFRPIIAVHKWFARRPGTLFRGLVLSEFSDKPLAESFFQPNDFPGKRIADPFMGGGTPLLEANRVGCDVQGFDINPMSAWIVREEIEHLDLDAYAKATRSLLKQLKNEIGAAYTTNCPRYGDQNVPAKYFLWVKTLSCEGCGTSIDLFPGYRIAEDARHPKHVLVCSSCGELSECSDPRNPGKCAICQTRLHIAGPARRNRCTCPRCGRVNSYPRANGPLRHRMFAIEYYNPDRRAEHDGRFFKKPDSEDLSRYEKATRSWQSLTPLFVPEQEILPGDETDRLHRWGYRHYHEMFNERQLLGLEMSCALISKEPDERIRHALATNLSDLLRYQNLLCRYDTMALKSLDIFSVHGFPVGLVQCESNFLGISNGNGANVGSGGWSNIVDKYFKAKKYCDSPFEIRVENNRKHFVDIKGEWIGERLNGPRRRSVEIKCGSAASVSLEDFTLDAVFTDPPYFGNVQYGELMDFCYVWLKKLVGNGSEGFSRTSTRSAEELTGNLTEARGIEHFAEGLSSAYKNVARALKPGAPLVFTFHHNRLEAYRAVVVAILDAELVCSATLPCPAEMSGSIHIHGTKSSIIDTVFVCRHSGHTKRRWLFENDGQFETIVRNDVEHLQRAGVKPTLGDVRCIAYGHLARMAVWQLRNGWDPNAPIAERMDFVSRQMSVISNVGGVIGTVADQLPSRRFELADMERAFDWGTSDAVSF